MDFRPCIDLHGGKVKQIVGSSLNDSGNGLKTNFISDKSPAYYAEMYRRDQLSGGHVIMLGPGNDAAAKSALNAFPGGLQLGGGINADNATHWLEQGASHVILTSYIFKDGEFNRDNLDRILEAIGKDKLVLDLSCRLKNGKYYIVTDRWQKFTRIELTPDTLRELGSSCAEFLIHAVDVEGKQSGIDCELIKLMAQHSPVPCVYAGGIASFDDIKQIKKLGGGKVAYTVGSALDIFGGKSLKYTELVKFEQD